MRGFNTNLRGMSTCVQKDTTEYHIQFYDRLYNTNKWN